MQVLGDRLWDSHLDVTRERQESEVLLGESFMVAKLGKGCVCGVGGSLELWVRASVGSGFIEIGSGLVEKR